MSKLLFVIFFILSIPSIVTALPKCTKSFHNCKALHISDSGTLYYGEWANKTPHGWGTLIWPDGAKYVGNFLNGKAHGWGEYTFNGEKYEGEHFDGTESGWGVYTYGDGTREEGIWKKGKFLYAKKKDSNTRTKALKFAGRKIVENAGDTNFPNLTEYTSRPSIDFSKLHPAFKFILEKESDYSLTLSQLAIEEATKCSFKARFTRFNMLEKVKIDFNKINWKTWSLKKSANSGEFTFLCKENCLFKFEKFNNYKWKASKEITFYFSNDGNRRERAIKALTDLSKACDKATSQY